MLISTTQHSLNTIENIRSNTIFHGTDKDKLKDIHRLETANWSYILWVYLQDSPIHGKIIHCKAENTDGSENIDIAQIQAFLSKTFPSICFIQVFPKDKDFINEWNTFHFFWIGKASLKYEGLTLTINQAYQTIFDLMPLGNQVRTTWSNHIPPENFMARYWLSRSTFWDTPTIQVITPGELSKAGILIQQNTIIASSIFPAPNLQDFRKLH
jgi:hypothetical protein